MEEHSTTVLPKAPYLPPEAGEPAGGYVFIGPENPDYREAIEAKVLHPAEGLIYYGVAPLL